MSRTFTGVPRVGRRTETRKDGTKYIYERTTVYDQETKKIKVLGCKLIGKILPGADEIIKTRPKRAAGTVKKSKCSEADRVHVGASDILEFVGSQSGIDKAVLESMPEAIALKALSIARYFVATDGQTLPRLEAWQINHPVPYEDPISEVVYGDLFKQLGTNETWIQSYFRQISSTLQDNPTLALDSTTLSTYSSNQIEARYGFNKAADHLPTIKFVTLYSIKDHLPIAYCKQPGNIPDVISIQNALKQLKALYVEKPLVVTDNGYMSLSNVVEFLDSNMKFLTLADRTDKWISKEVDQVLPKLQELGSICPFDNNIRGVSVSKMQEFKRDRKRSTQTAKAGEKQSFERRIYLHILLNRENQYSQNQAFEEDLLDLKAKVLAQEELNPAAQQKADKYLIQSRLGRGGNLSVEFNEKACAERRKYFGVFVLLSNKAQDCFEALKDYRLREKTEEAFAVYKDHCDGTKTRVWTGDVLRGRQFVQFLALSYRTWLYHRVNEVKEELRIPRPELGAEKTKQRKKLSTWLANRSLAQILDWFDCIEQTCVKTKAGQIRWKTETTARDKLFLNLLGMRSL